MSVMTRLFCAAALSFVTCVAGAQGKNPAAAIVGTWKVVTYEDRTEGQPVKYPFGEKPRGLLVYDAYAAYFGTYTVDAKRSVVVHHVEGDLYDVFIGTDQERPFEISGDRLILRPKWTEGGKQWTGLRVFERVK